MLLFGAVFIAIGLFMLVEGVEHTLSGEPIPATTWTQASNGPETVLVAIAGIGIGLFAVRKALRGEPEL